MKGIISTGSISIVLILAICFYSYASDPGIIQTESQEVISLTEEIGGMYGICPELLQAMIFYESSNNPDAYNAGCAGYMQISIRWHENRMERLGVTDLNDGYGNILVGTDYLAELAGKYEDIGLALMKYNGDSRADEFYRLGKLSRYAQNILELSAKLERIHGK